MYQWCGFKSRRGKNKNLTALKPNSNTVWFNFQTYIIFSINLVSFKVTLRSSGTDILYGCHLLLDVCILKSSWQYRQYRMKINKHYLLTDLKVYLLCYLKITILNAPENTLNPFIYVSRQYGKPNHPYKNVSKTKSYKQYNVYIWWNSDPCASILSEWVSRLDVQLLRFRHRGVSKNILV